MYFSQSLDLTVFPLLRYNNPVDNLFFGIRAALFDLDGTLVRTHIDFPFMKREMIKLAQCYAVPIEGLEKLDILTIVAASRGSLNKSGRHSDAAEFRTKSFARLERIEIEQCAEPEEIPGAGELLRALRANGVKIGVVTRNCRTVSERLLQDGGLVYDVLLTRDDVPETKPDPAHLKAALEVLGLGVQGRNGGLKDWNEGSDSMTTTLQHSIPSAVMIGDHWVDVQAGRAAGLRTVGLLLGRAPEFFTPAEPDHLVDQLRELLPLVERSSESHAARDPLSMLKSQHSTL